MAGCKIFDNIKILVANNQVGLLLLLEQTRLSMFFESKEHFKTFKDGWKCASSILYYYSSSIASELNYQKSIRIFITVYVWMHIVGRIHYCSRVFERRNKLRIIEN